VNAAFTGTRGFIAVMLAGIAIMIGLPLVAGMFGLVQATVFIAMAVLALSLGFIWGFGGIMCFGQSAFFGLGGYAYAIAATDFGGSSWAFLLSIGIPAAFAALLGYFMFYGRISDAYIGVITLTVTVILFNVVNSTSGSAYHIGAAELGGFNGMPSVPPINIPGDPSAALTPLQFFILSMALLLGVYAGLRWLLASKFGRVLVAIRENETRAMLLGYDPRLYKLIAFSIGGGIAGLAGCLYTNWGGFISPAAFSLTQSAQIIIFVLLGGIGTLVGPMLGAVAVEYLISIIGTQQRFDANLVLGVILLGFVLLVPQGVIPAVGAQITRRLPARQQVPAPAGNPATSP
jgi:ABC-type branched-subunit amino acid transport system permease subunit